MKVKVNRTLEIEASMPSLETLSAGLASGAIGQMGGQDATAARAFVKQCVDKKTFELLCRRAPACFEGLTATIVAGAAGNSETVSQLDPEEDDMPLEMAEALLSHRTQSEAMYKDEDDPRRVLYPVFVTINGVPVYLILRFPQDAEVSNFKRRKHDFTAAQTLIKKTSVWGDTKVLDERAPAAYWLLAKWLMFQAGDWSVEVLGE